MGQSHLEKKFAGKRRYRALKRHYMAKKRHYRAPLTCHGTITLRKKICKKRPL